MSDFPLSRRTFLGSSLSAAALTAVPWTALGDEVADPITVQEQIQAEAQAAPLAMRFSGNTAEECRAWQETFASQLRKLLGPHRPPEKWTTTSEGITELEDHNRESLVLSAPGHGALPVYLLTPKGASKQPRPAVLALHGHGEFGHDPVAGRDDLPAVARAIAGANYDYGRQLVRRGYVVACPCLSPFGRRLDDRSAYGGTDPCAVTFVRLQLLGKVLMAENLRDSLWALELLARRDDVAPERLGCVGLSYGGRMTMLTTALEPRIKAAIVSGALNLMQERVQVRYSCGAQVIPGLLQYGDVPEIGSLIAPRPCVWETGSKDRLIRQPWADQAIGQMQRAYAALGEKDHLQVDRFEGGHRFNGVVGLPLLDQVLGLES